MDKVTDKVKSELMQNAAKVIKDVIEKRLNLRLDAINTLAIQPLDNVPESIKKMREEEAAKIRAVIQEQREIIEMIKVLFPNG